MGYGWDFCPRLVHQGIWRSVVQDAPPEVFPRVTLADGVGTRGGRRRGRAARRVAGALVAERAGRAAPLLVAGDFDVGFRTVEFEDLPLRRQRRADADPRLELGADRRALRRAAAGEARASARARRAREREPAARVGRRPDRERRVLRPVRPARAARLAGVRPVELGDRERSFRRSGVRGRRWLPTRARSSRACAAIRRSSSGAAATSSTATTRRRCSPRCATSSASSIRSARGSRPRRSAASDVHGPWEHQGLRGHTEHYDTRTSLLHSEFGVEGMTNRRALEAVIGEQHRWPCDRSNPVYEHLGAWWNNAPLVQEAFGGADRPTSRRCGARASGCSTRACATPSRRRSAAARGVIPWQFNEPFPNAWCTCAVDYHGEPKPAYHGVARAYRGAPSARFATWAWGGEIEARAHVAGPARFVGLDGRVVAEVRRRRDLGAARRVRARRLPARPRGAEPLRDDADREPRAAARRCRLTHVELDGARDPQHGRRRRARRRLRGRRPRPPSGRGARGGRAARRGLECSSVARSRPTARRSTGSTSTASGRCATTAPSRSTPESARAGAARDGRSAVARAGRLLRREPAGSLHAHLSALHATGARDVERMESSAWSFRADRCATPAVFARGGGLVTSERSPLGQRASGSHIATDARLIWLDFPYREEPLRYDGSETPAPPDVQTYRWSPGESVALEFRRCDGDWRRALRDLVPNGPIAASGVGLDRRGGRARGVGAVPLALPRRTRRGCSRRSASTRDGDRDAMHVSWVSGVPYAYALLRHGRRVGNDEYVRAAEGVLDHVAANLTPGGTFWPQWTSERGWTWGWHPDHSRAHARTLADATLFMLRAGGRWEDCGALERGGRAAHAARRRRAAGGAPHRDGRRRLVGRNGRACRGSPRSSRRVTSTRRAAAGEYYARFDTWYGAPEDVDLAPTSEDGYAAVMAFVALEDWETARRAADWMLTFRYSYDVAFSRDHDPRPRRVQDARRRHGFARRTSTSTRSGSSACRRWCGSRARPATTIPRAHAREPRLLPPVHRARGRGLRRAPRDGDGALLPDRLLRREGRCSDALARVGVGVLLLACEEALELAL